MDPRQLAREIEAERFDRFGLSQGQLRIACSIVLDVLLRGGPIDYPTLTKALELYPALDFHADKEPYRCQVFDIVSPPPGSTSEPAPAPTSRLSAFFRGARR